MVRRVKTGGLEGRVRVNKVQKYSTHMSIELTNILLMLFVFLSCFHLAYYLQIYREVQLFSPNFFNQLKL